MIIKLSNGKTVEIADVVEDPKAKAIKWLRQYKKSPGRDPGSTTPIDSERSLCDVENSTTN